MRVWEDDSNCHSPFDQKIIIVQLRAIWLPAFRAECLNRVSVLFPAKKKMPGDLSIKENSGKHELERECLPWS